ncbi:hypothetical protein LguiA_005128 [Lonicera macranthoides]
MLILFIFFLQKGKSFKGRNSKFSFLSFLGEQLRNLHLLPLPPLKNSTFLDAGKPKIDRVASWGDPIPKVLIEKADEYIPEDFEEFLYMVEGDPIPKILIKKADEYIPEDFEEFIYMALGMVINSAKSGIMFSSNVDGESWAEICSQLGLSQLDKYSRVRDDSPAPYHPHSAGNQTAAHYFVAKRVFSSSALMAEALAIRDTCMLV